VVAEQVEIHQQQEQQIQAVVVELVYLMVHIQRVLRAVLAL
jgi:hypothetical protein